MDFNEYIGCLHIHINQETEKQILESIFYEAKQSGLDFIILTPHTPVKRRWDDYFSLEGYKDGLIVLTGEEADEGSSQNHILIYGNRLWLGKKPVEEIVSHQNNNLLMFAAHPDGQHNLFGFSVDHKWKKKNLFNSLTGIEVWSALFDFVEKTNPSNLIFRYFSFPHNLQGPSLVTLQKWDRILKKRRFVGVCGLDMHTLPFLIKLLDVRKIFSFRIVFKTLRNHILTQKKITGDFEKDRDVIVDAFMQGKVFFANDFIADSRGFFLGSSDKKKTMGDFLSIEEEILVEIPEKSYINIKIGSKIVYSGNVKRLVLKPDVFGACRVEAFYKEKAWIFSNPIFIQHPKN